MTATTVRESTQAPGGHVPVGHSPGDALAGTGTLIRFILRRDRIRLAAWLLGTTVLLLYFAKVVLPGVAGTAEQLRDLRRLMEGAVGAVFGPGYGRDDITWERYIAGVYGLFFFVLAALMSMLLVAAAHSGRGAARPGGARPLQRGGAACVAHRGAGCRSGRERVAGDAARRCHGRLRLRRRRWGPVRCQRRRGGAGLRRDHRAHRPGHRVLPGRYRDGGRDARRCLGGAGGGRHDPRLRQRALVVLAAGLVEPDPAVRGRPLVAAAALGRPCGGGRGGRVRAVGAPGPGRRPGSGSRRKAGRGAVAALAPRGRVPAAASQLGLVDGRTGRVRPHVRSVRRSDDRPREHQ